MPLPKITRERATAGTSGRMRQDILALSDPTKKLEETRDAAVEANAAQNLKKAFSDEQTSQMKSLNDQAADQVMQQFRSPGHKRRKEIETEVEELAERAKDMDELAKGVKESGTGNTKAYNTYMQVADILRKRLHALQTEGIQLSQEGAQ